MLVPLPLLEAQQYNVWGLCLRVPHHLQVPWVHMLQQTSGNLTPKLSGNLSFK